ncbi:MAG: radical SAM family heme chaperone HemW [Clostridia bacterium]
MSKEIGIYIHIPFCKSKCHYCDFVSFSNKDELISRYIDALCNEILQNSEYLSEHEISTIYFGGGTPSYIASKYITKILNVLNLFNITAESLKLGQENVEPTKKELKEITIEINPCSATYDKLKEYKENGINRVSLGLQSTDDNILKTIGRTHTYSDFLNALKICKEVGIKNISVDLMYPLPNLTLEGFKKEIDTLMELKNIYDIMHISVYNLEVHKNTKIEFLINEGYVEMVDEDSEYQMRSYLKTILSENGFNNYEISNYAINGFESKHNTMYWNQDMYLGFGVAAASYIAGQRYTNTKDIDNYITSSSNMVSCKRDIEQMDKLRLYERVYYT